ncbi:hypothetical protein CMV_027686 [Castanea mollissima]|uniref:Uncharacterized protein n=1 Tax=Castanea mollissima TaxID=60419 RepID=A0A8J4Q9C5_9ROSI|nr:hypothetical protein CMV_027686 [Castanea mollissima]
MMQQPKTTSRTNPPTTATTISPIGGDDDDRDCDCDCDCGCDGGGGVITGCNSYGGPIGRETIGTSSDEGPIGTSSGGVYSGDDGDSTRGYDISRGIFR